MPDPADIRRREEDGRRRGFDDVGYQRQPELLVPSDGAAGGGRWGGGAEEGEVAASGVDEVERDADLVRGVGGG